MSPRTRGVLFAAVLACSVLAVSAEARGQHAAVLIVRVPGSATVELQGVTMPGSGPVRRFESPPLPAGWQYVYTVAATWHDDQGRVTLRREVTVRPGQQIELDLRPEALAARQQRPPADSAPVPRPPALRRDDPKAPEGPTTAPHPAGPAGPAGRSPSLVSRTDGLTAEERQLLEWTNAERARAGLPPLTPNGPLMRIAREHSAAMARRQTMAHTLDGSTFDARLAASGYAFRLAAENIAWGPATPREAVELWMNSPGHRANLLHPDHRDIGLGIAAHPDGDRYYTQVFAAPRDW